MLTYQRRGIQKSNGATAVVRENVFDRERRKWIIVIGYEFLGSSYNSVDIRDVWTRDMCRINSIKVKESNSLYLQMN